MYNELHLLEYTVVAYSILLHDSVNDSSKFIVSVA